MSKASSGKGRGIRPSKATKSTKSKAEKSDSQSYYTRDVDHGTHSMTDFSDQPGYVQLNGKWYALANLPPSIHEQLEQYDAEQQKNHRFITVGGNLRTLDPVENPDA
jgi:hypothetical protein